MAASSDGSVLTPSLQQCLEKIHEGKLDQVCEDKILMQFAEKFHGLHELSVYLDLTDVETKDIEQKMPPRSPKMQRFDMLRKWKEKKQDKATYRVLAEVLYQAQKLNLVDELCQLLNDVKRSHGDESQSVQQLQISHEQEQALLSKPSKRRLSKLHELSSKWYVLGIQLKVKENSLDTIEEKYGDDHVCMVKMFGEWLRCCKAPSFLVLIKALINIGRTDIAEEISNKQKGTSLDAVRAFLESQPDSQSESEDEEQDSTSEIPVEDSSCTREPNSQDLDTQSKSLVSQSTPLLPWPPECVLKYAEYLKCKYKAMSELPSPNWPPSIKVPVKIAVLDRTQPGSNAEGDENQAGDDFDMNDYYRQQSMQYDYLHGKIDSITGYKKEINLEDVFRPKPNKSPLKVLMDGAPGVGKTTQTKKACIEWANGKMLQHFQLVILVPLREASSRRVDCLEKLFPADDPELRVQVIKYIQETSGKHILLIFDGYDELSAKERNKDSLFLDVIKGNILSQCNVLVTSRPYASHLLQRLETINRHVEVLGFTEKQIETCIMENLNKPKAKELIRKLQERLDVASLCYVPLTCAIVMHVYQANHFTLPSTMTELYSKFILFCLKREAISVRRDEEMEKELCSLQESELPSDFRRLLGALSKMAYLDLCKDKLVFSYKDLKTCFSDCIDLIPSDGCGIESCCLGLVTSLMIDEEEYHYQFLHLSIQEFLAAWYVNNSKSLEQQVSFFREHLQNNRFHLVLLFLAGLSQFSIPSPEALFKIPVQTEEHSYVTSEKSERFLHLCHLIFESQRQADLYSKLFQCLPDKKTFNIRILTLFDCMVVAIFLCLTNHSWKTIELSGCQLSSRSVDIFCDVFCTYEPSHTTCEELKVRINLPSLANSVFRIPWLSRTTNILCTDLNNAYYDNKNFPKQLPLSNQLEHDSVLLDTSESCRMPQMLQTLEIEQCSSLVTSIALGATSSHTLRRLHVWKVNATGVLSICQALQQNSSVIELGISWHKNDSDSDSEDTSVGNAISTLLKVSTSIEILKLMAYSSEASRVYTHIKLRFEDRSEPKLEQVLSDEELADILSAANSRTCRLTNLHLYDTELVRTHSGGTWDFTQKYHDHCHMCQRTSFDVGFCDVHKILLPQLFCALNQSTLSIPLMEEKTIDLHCSGITSSRAIKIFQYMESNSHVENLILCNNIAISNSDSSGVAHAIGQMIERNTMLKKLNLSCISMNDVMANSIASALRKNAVLKEINLDMNLLSDSSIVEILSTVISNRILSRLTICGVTLSFHRPRMVCVVETAAYKCRPQTDISNENKSVAQFFSVLNSIPIIVAGKHLIDLSFFERSLCCLNLRNAEITSGTAINILQSLQQVVNVKELNLSNNKQMAENDSKGLCDAFRKLLTSSKTLKVLNVENCAISDIVAEGIVDGLEKNMLLEKMYISNNPLSVHAISDILSAAHSSLKCNYVKVCEYHHFVCQKSRCWMLEKDPSLFVVYMYDMELAKVANTQLLKVLKAIHLSSMPVKSKSVFFSVSGSIPLIDILPPLRQISESFSESGHKRECELFTSLKLYPSTVTTDKVETVRGVLSCECTFKNALNKTMSWSAGIGVELTSVRTFSTIDVTFQVDHNIFSTEKTSSLVEMCDLAEDKIMDKLLKFRSGTLLAQQCQYPVLCKNVLTDVFKESVIPNAIHLSFFGIADTGSDSHVHPRRSIKKCIVYSQSQYEVTFPVTLVANIFQSVGCNTNVQKLDIAVKHPEAETDSELVSIAVEKMLTANSTLKSLRIFTNSVILKGLATGIARNTTLHKLELWFNENLLNGATMVTVLSSASASNICQIVLSLQLSTVYLCRATTQSVWEVKFLIQNGSDDPTFLSTHKLFYAIIQSTMNIQKVFFTLDDDNIAEMSELNPYIRELHLFDYNGAQKDIDTTYVGNAIEKMLETSTTLTQLDITCRTFPKSLSKHIGAGIFRNKSLKSLQLFADIVTLNEILHSLHQNTHLEELIIILHCQINENDNVEVCMKPRLEVDSLLRANCSIKTFKILPMPAIVFTIHRSQTGQDVLVENHGYAHHLKHCDAINIFDSLQQNSSVQELALSWDESTAAESMSIGPVYEKMLLQNTVLRVLDLRYAHFSDNTAECIAAGLKENSSLDTLILNASLLSDQCPLEDETIAAIHSSANSSNLCNLLYSDIIKFFQSDTEDPKWYMAHKYDFKWPPKLINALGQSLMHITNTSCDIVLYQITASRMAKILQSLKALNMKQISLTCSENIPSGSDSEPDAVETMEKACKNLLAENTTLESLELTNCNVLFEHDLLVAQVTTAINANNIKSLKIFSSTDCGITTSGVLAIIQAVQSNTTLEVLNLTKQYNQRWSADSTSEDLGPTFEAMLNANSILKELCVKGLDIAKVIVHIFRGLCSNQSLLTLDVSGTIPDGEYIEALTNMLGQNTTLTDLCIALPCDWYLHFNHIPVVRALLKNTSLKSLKIQPYHHISHEEAFIPKFGKRPCDKDAQDMKDFLEEEMEGLRILEKPEFDSCTSSLVITELKAV